MTVDVVSTFKELQTVLQAGSIRFRNGVHCFFWGRLASFVTSTRDVSSEEDDKFKRSFLDVFQTGQKIDLERLAMEAQNQAQSIRDGRRDGLLVVGYWSNICYAFRHLETQDPNCPIYSADSYLAAVEAFSDAYGTEKLEAEMDNLSNGILVAQLNEEAGEMQRAQSIMQWASSASIGEVLAEYTVSPL